MHRSPDGLETPQGEVQSQKLLKNLSLFVCDALNCQSSQIEVQLFYDKEILKKWDLSFLLTATFGLTKTATLEKVL